MREYGKQKVGQYKIIDIKKVKINTYLNYKYQRDRDKHTNRQRQIHEETISIKNQYFREIHPIGIKKRKDFRHFKQQDYEHFVIFLSLSGGVDLCLVFVVLIVVVVADFVLSTEKPKEPEIIETVSYRVRGVCYRVRDRRHRVVRAPPNYR